MIKVSVRTDLAIECTNTAELPDTAYLKRDERIGEFTLNHIKISTAAQAQLVGRPLGEYITVTMPNLIIHGGFSETAEELLSRQINQLLPKKRGTVLVAGLGNTEITPDALGPLTAARVLATRHISSELARQIHLDGLKSVAVISTGVLGQTGIETAELLTAVCEKIRPDAVIVIDALCAASAERLGNTIQLTSSGITPGSGIKNSRPEISPVTLNTPVIALGMPTVIDACEVLGQRTQAEMVVTPKDIDMLIDRAATLIANAINLSLQPETEPEILRALV